MSVHAMHALTN